MTSNTKKWKIGRSYAAKNSGSYDWELGSIAFGDPFDLIYKREAIQEQQIEYRDLYRVTGVKKCRKKMLQKNEQL